MTLEEDTKKLRDRVFGMKVKHRIKCGWMKLRKVSGVLCGKRILMKLKGKFYRSVVRPIMLHDSKYWVVDRKIKQSMCVAEMSMLRWMIGVARKDRIWNEYMRDSIGVSSIMGKMRKNRLRWFEHVMIQKETKAVRVVMKMYVESK
ncbi:uncharacterized protein LOC112686036 [Sipha flava]|uniref:Uncharacterized protein LOC112686036 n=1 Tax=Sipha flava TaxID=143950 RepID=A0A8B8FTW3_9HEMI|nr:uncharacterized protein LOC112686036 [Sipha flava]